ncbi:MAG: GxxExxY protein [Gemmatimonadales bacterium]
MGRLGRRTSSHHGDTEDTKTARRSSERTIGAAIEVHRHLGPGLLESSYHSCLCRELELRGIAYQSKTPLPLQYKGIEIARGYILDLLIDNALIIEIKSVERLLPIHSSQLVTYMRLRKVQAGLLINFNVGFLSAAFEEFYYETTPPFGFRVLRASVLTASVTPEPTPEHLSRAAPP